MRLLLALTPILLAAPAPQPLPRSIERDHWIFFAVLEGLFADAPSEDFVKKVLEIDDKSGRYANFVYACGICQPTIEAFRAYRVRDKYAYGRKGDMVGEPRMDPELARLIIDGSPDARRAGLHKLVQKYIQRRTEQLRLTDRERADRAADIADRRKQGMESLRGQQLPWKECPSCEGAYDVFKR